MTQDAKSAERDRLAAALRANLRRRKAATRPARHVQAAEWAAESPAPRTTFSDAAADGESKG